MKHNGLEGKWNYAVLILAYGNTILEMEGGGKKGECRTQEKIKAQSWRKSFFRLDSTFLINCTVLHYSHDYIVFCPPQMRLQVTTWIVHMCVFPQHLWSGWTEHLNRICFDSFKRISQIHEMWCQDLEQQMNFHMVSLEVYSMKNENIHGLESVVIKIFI